MYTKKIYFSGGDCRELQEVFADVPGVINVLVGAIETVGDCGGYGGYEKDFFDPTHPPFKATALQSQPPAATDSQSKPPTATALQSKPPAADALQTQPSNADALQSQPPTATALQSKPPNATALQSQPPAADALQTQIDGVEIEFNPKKMDLSMLMDVFFAVIDPYTQNCAVYYNSREDEPQIELHLNFIANRGRQPAVSCVGLTVNDPISNPKFARKCLARAARIKSFDAFDETKQHFLRKNPDFKTAIDFTKLKTYLRFN